MINRNTQVASVGVGLMVAVFSGALRRASADAPSGRYVVAVTEVQDTQTGLIWQQADSGSGLSWSAAQSYCTSLGLNGHAWRAPSIKELQTLVDESRWDPAIDTNAFPGTASDYYWSSSRMAGSSSAAWIVHFDPGSTGTINVTTTCRVRCVR